MTHVSGPDFISVQVRDLERSASFYEQELGLERAPESPPGVVAFETSPVPFAVREPLTGTDLDAGPAGLGVLLSLRARDAQALHDRLRDHGVPIVTAPFDTPFGRTFVFHDPDGYAVAIHGPAAPVARYARVNLPDVPDAAPPNGFGERWEARVAGSSLAAEDTGLSHFRLRAGKRLPFVHRHRNAEEVYVVVTGTGRMKLDDEVLDVGPLDAIRVAPQVARAFEAGPDGLEFIVAGPHHARDGEPVDDGWVR